MKKLLKAIIDFLAPDYMTPDDVRDFCKKFPGKDMMKSYEEYGKREGHIK